MTSEGSAAFMDGPRNAQPVTPRRPEGVSEEVSRVLFPGRSNGEGYGACPKTALRLRVSAQRLRASNENN